MAYLKHDDGKAIALRNQQVLGDDSPLEFDDEGYAEVADQRTAEKLAAMHRHISLGGHGPSSAADDGGGEDEGDGGTPLEDLSHEKLKARAEDAGIGDDIDLRQKGAIIDALSDE